MRLGYLAIALIYLAVAGAGVTLHWYMGTQDSVRARCLRERFLHRDPQTGQQKLAGLVDILLPAVILGLAAGTIGSRWTPSQLISCVLLLSSGAIALLPLYAALLPQARFWWWGETVGERVHGLAFASINLGGLCGAFTLIACLLAQSFHRHGVELRGQRVVMTTDAILRLLGRMETEAVDKVVVQDSAKASSGPLLIVQKVQCAEAGRAFLIVSFRNHNTWFLSLSTEAGEQYVTCELEGVPFQVFKSCLLDSRIHGDAIVEVVRAFLETRSRPEAWQWVQSQALPGGKG